MAKIIEQDFQVGEFYGYVMSDENGKFEVRVFPSVNPTYLQIVVDDFETGQVTATPGHMGPSA